MKFLQFCPVVFLLLFGYGYAEEKKPLPPFSFERFGDIADTLRGTKFPIRIRALCEKLGGDDSIRMVSFRTSGERWTIYFNICGDVSEKGVFQLQVSSFKQEGVMLDWECSAPKLLYVREGIDFYYPDNFEHSEKTPNKPSEPTATSGRGSP